MLPIGSTAVSKAYEQAYKNHLVQQESELISAELRKKEQQAAELAERAAAELRKSEEIMKTALATTFKRRGGAPQVKEAAQARYKALTDAGNNVILYYKSSRKFYKPGHSKYLSKQEVLRQFKYSLAPTIILSYDSLQDVTSRTLSSVLVDFMSQQIRTSSVSTLLTFVRNFDSLQKYAGSDKVLASTGGRQHE